jgi:hypothetical protein
MGSGSFCYPLSAAQLRLLRVGTRPRRLQSGIIPWPVPTGIPDLPESRGLSPSPSPICQNLKVQLSGGDQFKFGTPFCHWGLWIPARLWQIGDGDGMIPATPGESVRSWMGPPSPSPGIMMGIGDSAPSLRGWPQCLALTRTSG